MQSLSPPDHHLEGQVTVVLPVHVGDGFDYLLPEGKSVPAGTIVTVPFGKKEVHGVVWGAGTQNVSREKLRKIIVIHDNITTLDADFMRFIDLTARYYFSTRNQVIKMVLSVPDAITYCPTDSFYSLATSPALDALSKRQREQMQTLSEMLHDAPLEESILLERSNLSKNSLKTLTQHGLITQQQHPRIPHALTYDFQRPTLNEEQSHAAKILSDYCTIPESYHCMLLQGVTGSGKTEVYFEAIETCLKQHQQILILLPEIALSVQWTQRFRKRFGFEPTVWHSGITPAQRRNNWSAFANGHSPVLVGARSALYMPLPRLGLIIVDEEHETTFKQEDNVMYHARDMAIARAHTANIPIILASATPSIETLGNVDTGKCEKITLTARFSNATLPSITPIDMRQHKMPAGQWLSPPVLRALQDTLANGKQSLLFLNRRGYAPLMLCRTCGHRFTCPECTSWLVMHRSTGKMHCHHCGFHQPTPSECPECHNENTLVPCGPGVERIYEETKGYFPEARIALLNSDHVQSRTAFEAEIEQIMSGNTDIIIGTQILAKGHHFPNLTMVGILDADLGLTGGDLRTIERSWQLLHQISGRAGRAEHEGKVYLQTWQPEHPLMRALINGEGDALIAYEKEARRESNMPPFGRLAAIILESKNESIVQQTAHALANCCPTMKDIQILGPAPAPLYRLRGYYRIRFLIKTPRNINIQRIIQDWLHNIKFSSLVKCKIDIDPYSFL